ncbi:MAG: hypothetical protein HOY69_10155 [Streptomyces sp.]|nr:hypothetical protein [Streptomyces sp.]
MVVAGWAEGHDTVRDIPAVLESAWAEGLLLPGDRPVEEGQEAALASSTDKRPARSCVLGMAAVVNIV